jgi:hypothetical protein
VIDLLGQVAVAARVDQDGLADTAHRASDLLRRGVVAYSTVA